MEQKLTKIPLKISSRQLHTIISYNESKYFRKSILMTFITEEEEEQLDAGEIVVIERDGHKIPLTKQNVQCYGIVDLSTNSDDFWDIADFGWFSHLTNMGVQIPARYNYKGNYCYAVDGKILYYDTFRPELVVQYLHGLAGKPERIVIFKKKVALYDINTIKSKTNQKKQVTNNNTSNKEIVAVKPIKIKHKSNKPPLMLKLK